MKYCHKCNTPREEISQPGAKAECPNCSEDLHVCLNCRFYDEHKPNYCRIDNVDIVINKEKANFCEEFQFADKPLPSKGPDKKGKTKEQWEKLFKKQ